MLSLVSIASSAVGYRQHFVEAELRNVCNDLISLVDGILDSTKDKAGTLFFLKMKGDYYRYIGEYTRGEDNKKVAQSALEAYNKATETANKDLKTTNPIRLGLALNFSVFYYEIMNEPSKACEMAK